MNSNSQSDDVNDNDTVIDKDLYKKNSVVLADDMIFPRATIDPKMIKLQAEVTEFVTSVILKHEKKFYELAEKMNKKEDILGLTTPTIIEMINESNSSFYNNLYLDIQNCKDTPITNIIHEMVSYANYGPHILLDKLLRLTLDMHLDINREKLSLDDLDTYHKSILNDINNYFFGKDILHILSKGADDDTPFQNVPLGEKPFDIIVDKQIEDCYV